MEDCVFRIKRLSDSKYYKGKSKFTDNGTYLSFSQLNDVLKWVKNLTERNREEISICIYNTTDLLEINLNKDVDISDIELVLNRDLNIKKIIEKE